MDDAVRTALQAGDAKTHQIRRHLRERRGLDAGNIVLQEKIDNGLFELRIEGAGQQVRSIGMTVAESGPNVIEVRGDAIESESARAEESQKAGFPHTNDQLLGGDPLVHGAGDIGVTQIVTPTECRSAEIPGVDTVTHGRPEPVPAY